MYSHLKQLALAWAADPATHEEALRKEIARIQAFDSKSEDFLEVGNRVYQRIGSTNVRFWYKFNGVKSFSIIAEGFLNEKPLEPDAPRFVQELFKAGQERGWWP